MGKLTAKVGLFLAVAVLLAPANARAGDAFLKLGITFDPDLGRFSNKWFVSVGSDWGFYPQVFWGLEFQSAYRSETEGDIKVQVVPANVLVNFKWKAETENIRPYAGGGLGLISSYVRTSGFGESEHDWVTDGGFQFMGGVEFSRRFAVDSTWYWSFLAGIRW
jgi:hypothetical protein